MSHISKGDVHAYLDGALGTYPEEAATHVREHLNACRECAQVLEGERRLRKEASTILAASAQGQVELDPYEELLARAAESDRQELAGGAEGSEGARSARPILVRRLYSLRWAAMVVVSLGAGWMARDLTRPAGDLVRNAAPELVFEEMESAPVADQDRLERDDAGVPAEAETLSESKVVVAGGVADADTPSDLQVAARRLAQAPVPPESQGAAAAGGGRSNADPGAGRLDDNVVLDQVRTLGARQRVELSAAPAVGAASTDVGVQAAERLAEEPQAEEPPVEALVLSDELRPAVDSRAQASLFGNLAEAPSPAVSRSTTPFLVPGLSVLDVWLAPEADGLLRGSGTSMVVTQELEDGRVVELRFVPQAGSDSALRAEFRDRNDPVGRTRPVDWSTAFREVVGGVAILSGPLTERELEVLLDRALGPR